VPVGVTQKPIPALPITCDGATMRSSASATQRGR